MTNEARMNEKGDVTMLAETDAWTAEKAMLAAQHEAEAGEAAPRRFADTALRIVTLATARWLEGYNEPAEVHFDAYAAEWLERYRRGEHISPASRALNDALRALPVGDLRKLHAIMYAGREDDDVLATARELRFERPENLAGVIAGKPQLHEYLVVGLRLAREQSVNLEGDFV